MFGNITKSGSIAWNPGYNSQNRYTLGGTSYNANGNLLTDTFNTYTWDADWGTVASVDGIPLAYDALGRLVEIGTNKQIAYGPTGSKIAIMSGRSLQQAFIPLAAGAQAVYNSSGLSYYRHPDWLGSSRFASTPSRTCYADVAYAPFGENYASACGTDLHFAGLDQDSGAAGLYDAAFRHYHATQGRWISPDPSGSFSLANPQSLNQYAYVGGNPLGAVDPLGLEACDYCLLGGGYGISGGLGPDNPGYCPPDRESCGGFGGGFGIGVVFGGGSSRGGTGGTGTGGDIANFPNGETNGLPTGYTFKPPTIWQTMGVVPIDNWCDWARVFLI